MRKVLNPAIFETVRKLPTRSSLASRPLNHNQVVLTLAPRQPTAFSKSRFTPKSSSPVETVPWVSPPVVLPHTSAV